jgi:hypothetical protein
MSDRRDVIEDVRAWEEAERSYFTQLEKHFVAFWDNLLPEGATAPQLLTIEELKHLADLRVAADAQFADIRQSLEQRAERTP